jgi:2'-5' RNA ligase
MATTEPTSAVIVRIPIPTAIARIRRASDLGAALDVPSHVTILFPFRPPGRLDPAVRRELAGIAAAHEPFEARFTSVGRFPGLLYLAPEAAEPFVSLTEACAERFPDYPPYAGAHDDIVPHLTVVEGDAAASEEVARQLEAVLPFSHRVRAIEVITPSEAGPWRLRWRLPLGRRRP